MSGLNEKIGALSTFLHSLEKARFGSKLNLYFRGHSKESYKLMPSIFRNAGWISNEARMLREVMFRCPNEFSMGMTTFQSLVKLQHYGLPTRLLDVSSNPLVALYFACETHQVDDEDGEVVIFGFDVEQVEYFDSDAVSVISNLSHQPAEHTVLCANANRDPNSDGTNWLFKRQQALALLEANVRTEKLHLKDNIKIKDLQRVLCVKPLLDNPRIIRQEGAFLLFGCGEKLHEPARLDVSTVIAKLTINRNSKHTIREQLQQIGISRATLYPEIEHVALQTRESYSVPRLDLGKASEVQIRIYKALGDGNPKSDQELWVETGLSAIAVRRGISDLQGLGVVRLHGTGRERRWKLAERLEVLGGEGRATDDSSMENLNG